MKAIPPILLNSTNTTSTAPTSMDPAVWNVGTPYVFGNRVQVAGTTNKIYECIAVSVTGGNSPEIDVTKITPKWVEIGGTNKYAMFDALRDTSTVTTTATSMTVLATLTTLADSVGILRLSNVTQVVVKGYSVYPGTVVYNKTYNTTGLKNLIMFDLPTAVNLTVEVIFTGTAPLSVGSLVMGKYIQLGILQTGSECLSLNFSSIDRDTFGIPYIIKRRSIPKLQLKSYIEASAIQQLLADRNTLNAVSAIWVGIENQTSNYYYNALIIQGFFREFSFEINNPIGPMINLEIEET